MQGQSLQQTGRLSKLVSPQVIHPMGGRPLKLVGLLVPYPNFPFLFQKYVTMCFLILSAVCLF